MVSSRTAIVLLVAASSLAVALSHDEDNKDGPEYSHTAGSKLGPENWGKLSPAYKLCGEGKRQSPIDIVTKQAVPNPNLDSLYRTYAAANATLVNNGKDITASSISTRPPNVIYSYDPSSSASHIHIYLRSYLAGHLIECHC